MLEAESRFHSAGRQGTKVVGWQWQVARKDIVSERRDT